MSTITEILAADLITDSRADINNNFTALNDEKIETSVLDTDTTLAANSDSKIATQKAVKAYVDSGGNPNASETQAGIVEEATDAEVSAGTATGATGAKLFITPAKYATRITSQLSTYQPLLVIKSGAATYSLSTASGTQNIAHGLGVVPRIVRISGIHAMSSYGLSIASTVYTTAQSSCSGEVIGTTEAAYNTFRFGTAGEYQVGVVTVDATNIIISWTKTGSPVDEVKLIWEAMS